MGKIRPNDPCSCGSGIKYKKCCSIKSKKSTLQKLWPKKSKLDDREFVEGMRAAGRFNAQLLAYVKPLAKEGMTTNEIDRLVHEYTLDHGHTPAPLNYHGFPKSVCTSINNVVCHGIPCDEDVLKEGDIINIDTTTIVNGYFGDQSETLYIGEKISEDARKVTEVSRRSLQIGIEMVRPGISLYEVCGAIQDYVEGEGCSVVREFTGHGIGKTFHADPQVPHYRAPELKRVILKPGMTFTIEPMVNLGDWRTKVLDDNWTAVTLDGSLSAQFEHTLMVTEEGVEILTLIEE